MPTSDIDYNRYSMSKLWHHTNVMDERQKTSVELMLVWVCAE